MRILAQAAKEIDNNCWEQYYKEVMEMFDTYIN